MILFEKVQCLFDVAVAGSVRETAAGDPENRARESGRCGPGLQPTSLRRRVIGEDYKRALRLINLGVSAETLKVVMRHADFATTEKFYGAMRSAQAAATEVHSKRSAPPEKPSFVGGLVGGTKTAPQFSTEELSKLKALVDSL